MRASNESVMVPHSPPRGYAAEIGMFDGYIVVYKFIADLHFYVTGGDDENELILVTVLQAFFDAVSLLLR